MFLEPFHRRVEHSEHAQVPAMTYGRPMVDPTYPSPESVKISILLGTIARPLSVRGTVHEQPRVAGSNLFLHWYTLE